MGLSLHMGNDQSGTWTDNLPTAYSRLPCQWSSCLVLSVGTVAGYCEMRRKRPWVPVSGGTHRHHRKEQKMAPASSVMVSKQQNPRSEAGHSVLVWPSFFCSFRSPMQCSHSHKHTLTLFADPAWTSHHFLPQRLPNAWQPSLCIKPFLLVPSASFTSRLDTTNTSLEIVLIRWILKVLFWSLPGTYKVGCKD